MKITLNQLLTAGPAVTRLGENPLRPILARRVARIMAQAQPHVDEFYKIRNAAIQRYGKPLGDAGEFEVTPENLDVYLSEMNELAAEEFDLDARPITEELLDKEPDLLVTPNEINALGPLLVESE